MSNWNIQPKLIIRVFTFAAIFSACVTAGVMTLEGTDIFSFGSETLQEQEVKYIRIQFIVLDKENKPVENVNVRFISEGSPPVRLTDSDGFVGIDVPEISEIQIIFNKEGYKTINRTLDLRVDPEETLTIRMERE